MARFFTSRSVHSATGIALLTALLCLFPAHAVQAQEADEAAPGGAQQLIEIDRAQREVRVLCQALRVDMPLEFVCVLQGTADHESILRTTARPSEVHAALLALGLQPGTPLRFVPETKQWMAPSGPPLSVSVEWEENGQTKRQRVGRLMRHVESGEPRPPQPFVFCGSRVMEDGVYAADATGQLVSLVNFEFSVMDVPNLASNANETLQWEINPETMPPEGVAVWMILSPIGEDAATQPAEGQQATTQREAVLDEPPVQVVVVMVTAEGQVLVDSEPVAPAAVGEAVRLRAQSLAKGEPEVGDEPPVLAGSPQVAVRLSAPAGAPLDAVGGVLGRLVTSGITEVTFVPPPSLRGIGGEGTARSTTIPTTGPGGAVELLVGDGGRSVVLREAGEIVGEQTPLGLFVESLKEETFTVGKDRPIVIRPMPEATDLAPVDLAAPAAALHVAGYQEVSVDPALRGRGAPPTTGPDRIQTQALRNRWEQQVLGKAAPLQEAAQTHYEVMQAYQAEINRLLDEVERLRREMDQLQEQYNDLTTPQPMPRENGESSTLQGSSSNE